MKITNPHSLGLTCAYCSEVTEKFVQLPFGGRLTVCAPCRTENAAEIGKLVLDVACAPERRDAEERRAATVGMLLGVVLGVAAAAFCFFQAVNP